MSDNQPDDIELQLKLLRNQVARLVTQNLELKRQLEDLRRARTDASVESLATSTIQSLRQAEDQINASAQDGRRYAITDFQASYKGMLVPHEGTLDFRVPIPEYGAAAGHLSSVQMTFSRLPVLPGQQVDGSILFSRLERIQADFLAWERREGSSEASEVVAQVTYLISLSPQWTSPEFRKGLLAFAETLVRFSKTIQPVFPPQVVESYHQAAATLLRLADSLLAKDLWEPGDVNGLAAALEQLALVHQKL